MSLNVVVLIGRLTRDPEMRYTPAGIAVTSFTLAVDRSFANNGKREADFVPVVAWRKLAEIAAEHTRKGSLVAVEGRLQIRQYEANGQKKKVAEVVAGNIRFLGKKPAATEEAAEPAAAGLGTELSAPPEEDLPF